MILRSHANPQQHLRKPPNNAEREMDHESKVSLQDIRKSAKPRAILSQIEAVSIFKLKPLPRSDAKGATQPLSSATVARTFNVSEKTVRDIWKGRTWHEETQHLDPSRPARRSGPPGRPKGKKDSSPRQFGQKLERRRSAEIVNHCKSEDPFHDDWPYWARADVVSIDHLQHVILYTQRPIHSDRPKSVCRAHEGFCEPHRASWPF
jgi:hypothetical protein